jgi:hypothetical protein
MSPSTAPPSTTQRLLRHCLLNTSTSPTGPARLQRYILVRCFSTVSKECVKLSSIQLSNLHSRYATLACRSAAPLVLPAAARARAVGQQETTRSRTAQERLSATQSQATAPSGRVVRHTCKLAQSSSPKTITCSWIVVGEGTNDSQDKVEDDSDAPKVALLAVAGNNIKEFEVSKKARIQPWNGRTLASTPLLT